MFELKQLYFNHNCNSYLLINNDTNECILFDPGFNNNNCLINSINRLNLRIKGIFLTHGHYDHILGLETIKDYPVYIYKNEAELLTDSRLNCAFMANIEVCADGLDVIKLDEGDIDIIGTKIKVIHTPFHTSGCVCYYIKELKSVITGDTLFLHSIGRSDLPTSQTRFIESSLKKLFTLPHQENNNTNVYPGHGQKTDLLKEYLFFKKEFNL